MRNFPGETLLFSTLDELMAQHVRTLLENSGYSAHVRNLNLADGVVPRILAPLEVWVSEDSFDAAKEVLDRALSRDLNDEPAWTCVKCGEQAEAQFTECWSCGNSR